MIYIFHGPDIEKSRSSLDEFIKSQKGYEVFRTEGKSADFNQINLFINSQSLLANPRILVINNLFSANKAQLDKLTPILQKNDILVLIWQDKSLTATQLKMFPQALVTNFPQENYLFACLNQIKPHNFAKFLEYFNRNVDGGLVDLLLYLIKGNLRKQLAGYSKFDQNLVKTTYLKLIETDYLNKTGKLTMPLDVAVVRIMATLIQ
jgi:hypothetical protein